MHIRTRIADAWSRRRGLVTGLGLAAMLAACGTTYALAPVGEAHRAQAAALFAQARGAPLPSFRPPSEAAARFERVVTRVRPVAESFCRRETADRPGFRCDAAFVMDWGDPSVNAYMAYRHGDTGGQPGVILTPGILAGVQNDDELAFVLGHEYGHLIGRHHQKRDQQRLAGALILGALAAAGATGDPAADRRAVEDGVRLGHDLGTRAYSQTFELESDAIGAAIARAAGYDPVRGVRFFTRAYPSTTAGGRLSFWGTHPPDAARVATVIAAVEEFEAGGGLRRTGR